MTGAAEHHGPSKQDYGTPWSLIHAVERRFGPIGFDLAAAHYNAKHALYLTEEDDSLSIQWRKLQRHGLLWLNMPFKRATPWVKHCAEEAEHGARIAALMLASVGSSWFSQHVHNKALVLPLLPRVTFVGETQPYTKDVLLAVYGEPPGFEPWRWDEDT